MGKKKFTRCLSLILSLIMVLSVAVPTYAAGTTKSDAAVVNAVSGTSEDENAYAIYPIPQSVTYGDGSFTLYDKVAIVADEGIDTYTINYLKEVLDAYDVAYETASSVQSGKTNILLAVEGSKGAADTYADGITISDTELYGKNDAYMLDASKDVIVIEGKDTDCVYYGVATLKMMFSSFAGEKFLNAHIEDYATVATRGYIEGFYGSWDWESRADLMKFARDYKMNSYVYAAKGDSYHTSQWNQQYPASWINEFKELVKVSKETKVEFGWSIHMGSFFSGLDLDDTETYEARYELLMEKFDQLYQIGVRDFDILNDDFGSGSHEDVVTVLNRINADLKTKYADDPCDNISYCPQGYNESWSGNGAELTALQNLDDDIYLYWTGADVNAPITQSTVDFVTTKSGHAPDYWLNYPVNEHATAGIFLGDITYYARDGVTGLAAFHSNPSRYPYASEVGLYQLAALTWNNTNYSEYAQEVWASAFDYLQPEVSESYYTIAKNISNAPNSSRVPGFNESEYLTEVLENVTKAMDGGAALADNADVLTLLAEFENIIAAIVDFRANCANEVLVSELDPWLNSLDDLAHAGRDILESLIAMDNGDYSAGWEKFGSASQYYDTVYTYTNPANNTAKAGTKRLYPFVTAAINAAKSRLTPILDPSDTSVTPSFIGVIGGTQRTADDNTLKMYDGDLTTYAGWQTDQKAGDYFGLDLGRVITVNDVTVIQGKEDGHHDIFHKAVLQYSVDNETWTDFENVTVSEDGCEILVSGVEVEARYVRYYLNETGTDSKANYWTFIREFTVNQQEEEHDRVYTNVEELKQTPLTLAGSEVGVRDLDGVTLEAEEYIGVKFVEPQVVTSFAKVISGGEGLELEYSFNESEWYSAANAAVPVGAKYLRLVNHTANAITVDIEKIAVNVQYLKAEPTLGNSTVSGGLGEGSYDNVFDGDLTTYALTSSAPAAGNYITFDLGKTIDVYDVAIVTTDGNEHLYNAKIQISTENGTWTDIGEATGTESFTPPYRYIYGDGEGQSARYLRIYFTGGSSYQLKLQEILINEDVEAGDLSGIVTSSMSGNLKAVTDKDISTLFTASAEKGDYIEYRISENAEYSQVSILQSQGGKGVVYAVSGDEEKQIGVLSESVSIFDVSDYTELTAIRIKWNDAEDISIHEISVSMENSLSDDIGEYVEPLVVESGEAVIRNLAPGKTVTVSGTSDGNKDYVNDMDTSTKWDSNAMKSGTTDTGDAWIYIDLGADETYEISQIVVSFFNKIYPTSWVIQSSDDAETWTDVTDVMTKKDGGATYPVETVDFETPFTARYVRLYFNTLNTAAAGNGVGITELEIYGREKAAEPTPTPTLTPTPTPEPTPTPDPGQENPFTDVGETDYYYAPVLWAYYNGVTDGATDTTFDPNGNCTRGQVVTFLWRAAGSPEPSSDTTKFTDVHTGDYYYDAVLWAVEKGITDGTSDTEFSPNQSCTRGQVVTFLWRAENQPETAEKTTKFTDIGENDYYYTAVLWAVEKGITDGTSETEFSPNKDCTRGQVVTFLYRAQ